MLSARRGGVDLPPPSACGLGGYVRGEDGRASGCGVSRGGGLEQTALQTDGDGLHDASGVPVITMIQKADMLRRQGWPPDGWGLLRRRQREVGEFVNRSMGYYASYGQKKRRGC